MGERTSDEADRGAAVDAGNDVDVGELQVPPGSQLAQLLADPRTRKAVLQRIAERKKRMAAEHAKKSGAGVVALEGHEHKDKPKHPLGADEHKGEREYHDVHGSASLERKPNSDITDAKVSAGMSVAQHERQGKSETVDERKAKVSVSKADGLELTGEHSHETGNEEAGEKSGNSVGVKLHPNDAHVTVGHESESWESGQKHKTGTDASAGIKNGKLDAEIARATRDENALGADEHKKSIGFKDDRVELGLGNKSVLKHPGDKESSTGHDATVGVGKDSVALGGSRTTTNTAGTTSKTAIGGEYNWKEGNASASASRTYTTKGGASASGSVKAGVHLEASIEEVDEHTFVVHYTRGKDVGMSGGGGKHGASADVSVGSSDFVNGSRTFGSKKEAEEFKETLPHELPDAPDPRSVDGAMKLAVGESRGVGEGENASFGGSGTVEGANVNLSHHQNDSSEVDVKRVSETVFEVTSKTASAHGLTGGVGGLGTSVSRDATDDASAGQTVRFDVSTPEGTKGFEEYCRDPSKVPKGGQLKKDTAATGHTYTETVGLWGDSEKEKRHTGESKTTEDGKTSKDFEGDQGHEHKAGWVGRHLFSEKDENSSVAIDSRQVDDKVDGYTVTASIGGESGAYNRGKMRHMLDSDEAFDEKKAERSGQWTMTSDLEAKQIAGMERYKQRFAGKGDDDKMRALSQWVANDGMNAINTMQRDWGVQMSWDLELKGDKNFPGRAGREELEARVQQYGQTLADNPGGAPAVLAEVQGEIQALHARREAVQSKSRYTDLPEQLRAQQLQLIDREIAALSSLQHRAAVESTKNQPGESGGAIATRAHDGQAHAGLPGPLKQVAALRDQIAVQDASVAGAQKDNAEADAAMAKAMKQVDFSKRDAGRRFGASGKLCTEARALDQAQRADYLRVDELRLALLRSTSDPAKEATVAGELLARVTESANRASAVNEKYYEAAKVQVLITRPAGLAGHDAFWNDVRDSMDTGDFADELDDAAPASGGTASAADGDDDDEPHGHVGMALPGGKHK
jgi:hypothetical protein